MKNIGHMFAAFSLAFLTGFMATIVMKDTKNTDSIAIPTVEKIESELYTKNIKPKEIFKLNNKIMTKEETRKFLEDSSLTFKVPKLSEIEVYPTSKPTSQPTSIPTSKPTSNPTSQPIK